MTHFQTTEKPCCEHPYGGPDGHDYTCPTREAPDPMRAERWYSPDERDGRCYCASVYTDDGLIVAKFATGAEADVWITERRAS